MSNSKKFLTFIFYFSRINNLGNFVIFSYKGFCILYPVIHNMVTLKHFFEIHILLFKLQEFLKFCDFSYDGFCILYPVIHIMVYFTQEPDLLILNIVPYVLLCSAVHQGSKTASLHTNYLCHNNLSET